MANYSQYCMFDKYSGTKFFNFALYVEPAFPMHCQRRSRWFFSRYQVSIPHTAAEALLVKVMNAKRYEL